jgi:hypothetical protein
MAIVNNHQAKEQIMSQYETLFAAASIDHDVYV